MAQADARVVGGTRVTLTLESFQCCIIAKGLVVALHACSLQTWEAEGRTQLFGLISTATTPWGVKGLGFGVNGLGLGLQIDCNQPMRAMQTRTFTSTTQAGVVNHACHEWDERQGTLEEAMVLVRGKTIGHIYTSGFTIEEGGPVPTASPEACIDPA